MSWTRVGTWAVALVIGVVFGVAGTIGQAAMWGPIPLGLVIAVIGAGALILAVRLLSGDRWTALACALGAVVATLVFSGKGPGGSVVVPAPPTGEISTGIIWTFALPVVAAIIVGWPSLTATARKTDGPAARHELD
ncbi:MAG: histidinol dehydrogenase [Microbacterium sp. SCN 70-27]|uniref:histidinol dehydrogenase n=1 Tax=unclassified Microbacterium TaxID=2609290 RepID=UPI00086EF94E|nr:MULTISPECIES: histidinol dehydrogenase [unclassified Microbacterium]MBN9224725.1 histidinol dehydrogenase [Microbacterium sp.]ODT28210.1 MAG: histidinol dehydrogenase [Microbacterium sp. SCN 70-27]